jgi:hypothetical protein
LLALSRQLVYNGFPKEVSGARFIWSADGVQVVLVSNPTALIFEANASQKLSERPTICDLTECGHELDFKVRV